MVYVRYTSTVLYISCIIIRMVNNLSLVFVLILCGEVDYAKVSGLVS